MWGRIGAVPISGAMVELPPVVRGRMLGRMNRFLALVALDGPDGRFGGGGAVRAHVPGSGRMGELLYPGAPVMVSPAAGANRGTQYTILLAAYGDSWVSVDSHLPNKLAFRAIALGDIVLGSEPGVVSIRREAPLGGERLDLLVETDAGHVAVEVKSVTLVRDGVGYFPDAPTERGTRQVRSLEGLVWAGLGACVLFLVQREDAVAFSPHTVFDPSFSEALLSFRRAGGMVRAFQCRVGVSPPGVWLGKEIPILFGGTGKHHEMR